MSPPSLHFLPQDSSTYEQTVTALMMNDYDNKLRQYKANNIRWFTILFWGKFLQISIEIFLRMKENVESWILGRGKVYFQHSKEPTV